MKREKTRDRILKHLLRCCKQEVEDCGQTVCYCKQRPVRPRNRCLSILSRVCCFFALTAVSLAQTTLPGTAQLTADGDLAAKMVAGINLYLERATTAARAQRGQLWKRDYSSPERYRQSIAPNRERFRKIIGAVDPRVPVTALQLDATTSTPALIATGAGYKVYAVRWPVLEGVQAEGLLLDPDGTPTARIVAIPDADWTPEMLAGLAPGVPPAAQFARRLAENGCQVLVPLLIDRRDTWSGIPGIRMTNQPHREWIYRMAFEAGRHIIGYEVQKVLAAVDWFATQNARHAAPIAVAGYGEGGLLALASGALDERIEATLVSGYFQPREAVWSEPVYRDVWGLLREFGDAELAGLIAPRALIVATAAVPHVDGPPPVTPQRTNATPNGKLTTPAPAAVREEVERARPIFRRSARGTEVAVGHSARARAGPLSKRSYARWDAIGRSAPGAAGLARRFQGPLRSRAALPPPVRSTGGLHAEGNRPIPRSPRALLVESRQLNAGAVDRIHPALSRLYLG